MRGTRRLLVVGLASVGAFTLGAPASSAATQPSAYTIWTIAGTGAECTTPPNCGDGGAATAGQLSFPQALALDSKGDVLVADWGNSEVRRISPTGEISLVAGGGTICQDPPACGDGGPATGAALTAPDGLAVDAAGNVYIADTGDNEIRRVAANGTISRVAGTGLACAKPPACGDGGPGTSAQLNNPTGLAIDRHGNLYIADTGDQEIRKLSPSGTITRVAGTGQACAKPPSCGDGSPAIAGQLDFPQGVALDHAGGLYIADTGDQEIRRISRLGTISRVAGNGTPCSAPPSCGDGAAATSAQLTYPTAVAAGPAGQVFIADSSDNELRVVSSGGTITRVAGNGAPCTKPPACGDSRRGSAATLSYPEGLAVDGAGNLYLADTNDNELRWLSTVHAGRLNTGPGPVAVAAFATLVGANAVTVRYVVGQAASLTLEVSHRGHSEVAGSAHGASGFGELVWNRRFRGRHVAHGHYKLTVTASIGSQHASSTISVRL